MIPMRHRYRIEFKCFGSAHCVDLLHKEKWTIKELEQTVWVGLEYPISFHSENNFAFDMLFGKISNVISYMIDRNYFVYSNIKSFWFCREGGPLFYPKSKRLWKLINYDNGYESFKIEHVGIEKGVLIHV